MYYSLHNHTDFSNASCGFMDSINKTEDLINYAFKIGLRGVAITDHESVSAHVRAIQHYKNMLSKAQSDYDNASEEDKESKLEELEKVRNFRVILGNEIYIGRNDLTSETYQKGERFLHTVLLAKNQRGQEQLRELSTRAWDRGFFRAIQRRFNVGGDFADIIMKEQGNVVATTACLGGPTGHYFLTNAPEEALILSERFIGNMQKLFGEDNFFIELAPSKHKDQTSYNKFMYQHFKDKANFIIATDSHYLNASEFNIFKTVLNSGSGEREVEDFYKYSHMMTWEEIKGYFSYLPEEFIEDCRRNTVKIGQEVEFYDLKAAPVIPWVPFSNNEILRKLPHGAERYEFISKFFNSDNYADKHYLYKIFERFEELILPEKYSETLARIDLELKEVWGISEVLGQRMSNYLITVAKVIDIMWNEADAIVGPGRGSAVAFVTNYLLGITQLNPMDYPVPIHHWRFITAERPDLPDIDIDTAGNKRLAVLQAISDYFKEIGGSLTQICTYGTEGAKSAIRTAARGLNLDDDIAMYISSLVPSERGIQFSLDMCYHGDDSTPPTAAFVTAMDSNPELWKVAKRIEGIITRLGIHAAGVLLSNQDITKNNSLMRSKNGLLITAYDLHDSEYMGGVKYDFLSIDGLGKIHAALNFMLKDKVINWQGSLLKTYKKYLWPDALKYDDRLWQNIAENKINSLWQLNTDVGTSALASIHANSLKEIGMINSLMRLQPQNKGDEQPLKTFERFRNNIDEWYQELRMYGMSSGDVKVLEDHLLVLNGIADTQESVMQLTMDPRVSGFSVVDANKLRKGIAKKSAKAQAEAKQLFFSKGLELGTNPRLLQYIWDVQIGRQLGYSFSLPHIAAYSIIAMQQANLYTHYPSIYWNTACLTVDAGANQEEDLQDLIRLGYIKSTRTEEEEETDEDGERKLETTAIDRGKIAAAIGAFQKTIKIEPPEINTSGFGFMPNAKTNAIVCGLKIVGKIGDQLIYDIIQSRPYHSFEEFIDSVKISKDRVVNLIKANAFREIDNREPMQLLYDYVLSVSDQKKRLTLQNLQMLFRYELLSEFKQEERLFNWVKYVKKSKNGTFVKLDERARTFYEEQNLDDSKIQFLNGEPHVSIAYIESVYKKAMVPVKNHIAEHQEELLSTLNNILFMEEWDKYKMETPEEGEMQSMRMYVNGHELSNVQEDIPFTIDDLNSFEEEETDGNFFIDGKFFPRYRLRHIVGTVINKDKLKSKITVLTPSGPVDVKIWKNMFAFYDQTLVNLESEKKEVIQDSFLEIGTHLLLTGFKRGTNFVLKKYKTTKIDDTLLKINLRGAGGLALEVKIKEEDLHSGS